MRSVIGLATLLATLALVPTAGAAPTAQIDVATVDAAWTKARVVGSVSCTDCAGSNAYIDWLPVVTAQPSLPEYSCRGDEWADSDQNTRVLWSGGKKTGNTTVRFDLADALILPGVFGQRVCVLVVHTSRYQEPVCLAQAPILGYPPSSCPLVDHIVDDPVTSGLLTVAPPAVAPPTDPPAGEVPPPALQPEPTPLFLSMTKARAKAKVALRAALGRRWVRGTKKKLSCARESPGAVKCAARWRYKGAKLLRRVSVTLDEDGLTAAVRR